MIHHVSKKPEDFVNHLDLHKDILDVNNAKHPLTSRYDLQKGRAEITIYENGMGFVNHPGGHNGFNTWDEPMSGQPAPPGQASSRQRVNSADTSLDHGKVTGETGNPVTGAYSGKPVSTAYSAASATEVPEAAPSEVFQSVAVGASGQIRQAPTLHAGSVTLPKIKPHDENEHSRVKDTINNEMF